MKHALTFLIAGLLCVACAGPPALQPLPPAQATRALDRCRRLFPDSAWRMVHTIAAELPGQQTRTVIGISLVYPRHRTIQAVLMTVEGLVLFDAVYGQTLDVHRALPPFDSDEFARGLMQDVQLIFLEPDAKTVETGMWGADGRGCRYRCKDGRTVDVIAQEDGSWQLSLYDGRRPLRQINADPCRSDASDRIPCRLSLTAHGRLSYHLDMSLIEAEPVRNQPAESKQGDPF
jgi:hypothetical protein